VTAAAMIEEAHEDPPPHQIPPPFPNLGHEILHSEFLLNYTNMNHGSYGACPKPVLEYQSSLRQQQEQQPDVWMRQRYKELLNETRHQLAQYLQLPEPSNEEEDYSYDQSFVVVESASTAINSILRSMTWQPGDIALMFDVEYAMNHNTAAWLQQTQGIEIVQVPIHFPMTTTMLHKAGDASAATTTTDTTSSTQKEHGMHETFILPLQQALERLQQQFKLQYLKVAIFDHMVSAPGIVEPIVELATLVKQYTNNKCFVLIDGAHALGQIPNPMGWLNHNKNKKKNNNKHSDDNNNNSDATIPEEQTEVEEEKEEPYSEDEPPPPALIDAYTSNGHKWFYSPKGSAILWVNPAVVTALFPEPTVISSANTIPPPLHHQLVEDEDEETVAPTTTAAAAATTTTTTTTTTYSLADRYNYVSSRDYTAWIAMSAALTFRAQTCGGESHIYNYTRQLALDAKHYLLQRWNVPSMFPNDMEVFMINVPLPESIANRTMATQLQEYLLDQHQFYVIVIPMWWLQPPFEEVDDDQQGPVDAGMEPQQQQPLPPQRFYTRLSAQIYLELSDFVQLGDLVLKFIEG
jgi:selenocysteine lyase/cysteine desulfurase